MRLISTQVVMDALDTTGPGCNVALEEALAQLVEARVDHAKRLEDVPLSYVPVQVDHELNDEVRNGLRSLGTRAAPTTTAARRLHDSR